MPDFTPEAEAPSPTEGMLARMAYRLCLVPEGEPVHRVILDVLRRQYIAAHEVAAEEEAPARDWRDAYSVSRGSTALGEVVYVKLPEYSHAIPRAHAVYLHGLMACLLSPPRSEISR